MYQAGSLEFGSPVRRATFESLSETPLDIGGEKQILLLWKKAIEHFNSKLTKDEKKKLDLAGQQQASFNELLNGATQAKEIAEGKRYRYTDTIQKICGLINQYATAGDILVQHHAEYTSLAWGAFRFLLLFAVQEGDVSEKLTSSLELIAQIVFRANEYAKHFSTGVSSTDGIHERFYEDLTLLYAEVLNFLIRAKIFLEKSTFRRYFSAGFKPFNTAFKNILEQIKLYEGAVEKDIRLLRTEREIIHEEYEDGVWLLGADFTTELKKLQDQHLDGTGEWFLENNKVENWVNLLGTSFLWVQGKPGSGKSTLAAFLIRRLNSSNAPVLTIFCKTGEENKNNLLSILRNIIFQLLKRSKSSQKALHETIRAARLSSKTQNAQSMHQLWLVLRKLLDIVPECFCIIDALDECSDSGAEVSYFVNHLTRIISAASATVKVLVTSRLERPVIDSEQIHSWKSLSIQNPDVEDDIELFVSVKINNSPVLSRHSSGLRDRLQKALISGSEGMILWASLMVSELEAEHWNVDAVLKKPPTGFSALYTSILHRLVEKSQSFAVPARILQLVLAAARPLKLDEFVFGIAMLAGSSDDVHEYYQGYDFRRSEGLDLINRVSPLITLMPDETVQLVHASLKDFLLGQDLQNMAKLDSRISHFSFNSRQLHEPVASALASYLSFQCFREDTAYVDMQSRFPLKEYSSRHIIWHLIKTVDISAQTTQIFVNFFASTQGWRWLEQLMNIFGFSIGSLQILQSQLNEWIDSIPHETGAKWKESGINNFTLELWRNRLRELRQIRSDSDQLTIKAALGLADVYFSQGRYKETEDLGLQVLASYRKVLEDDHPDALSAMEILGNSYCSQGRYKEAEDLGLQLLTIRKKALGDDHPDTLHAMRGLAYTYNLRGRYKEAEDLGLQVLASRRRVLDDDHPDTLWAMEILANTYHAQARYKEAEDLRLKVLTSRKKVLEDDHPNTLWAMGNLANTYYSQARYKEAEDLGLQLLACHKKILGDDHPDTLKTMEILANTNHAQERYKEAEDLRLEALASHKRVLGDNHPDTLRTMGNLASTYHAQGRHKEAEGLELQVLVSLQKVLGKDHPDTLEAKKALAWTYKEQGRHEEVERLYKLANE